MVTLHHPKQSIYKFEFPSVSALAKYYEIIKSVNFTTDIENTANNENLYRQNYILKVPLSLTLKVYW